MPKAPTPSPAPTSASDIATPAPKSFEAALGELERLVGKMESGTLTLEQSLAAHQRGLELAKFCQETLARAEQQVKVLEDDMLKTMPARRGSDNDLAGEADDE